MKSFVFPVRWWNAIQTLTPAEQKEICLIILNYIFENRAPGILFGNAAPVWDGIAKEINYSRKRSLKAAACKKEKEMLKEQEESLSALSKEEKEVIKEKDPIAQAFERDLTAKYPNVARMCIPLTYDEYMKLVRAYPNSLIRHILSRMNSWSNLQTNLSAYRTCLNWLQREKKQIQQQGRWRVYEAELNSQRKILNEQSSY